MKLILLTQDHEWYGDSEHDGVQRSGRWKPKGGCDIEVATLTPNECTAEKAAELIAANRSIIEINNSHCRSEIIGHYFLEDDELTESERDQKEYEGRIIYSRYTIRDGKMVAKNPPEPRAA